MKKKTKKKLKEYTEKELAYFQAQNDMDEFMTNATVDGDYVDYLMGYGGNSYDGVDMDTEFNDLDGESDWYMD